jgi:hypothetical protein
MAGGRCRRPRHRRQAARVILEMDSVSLLRLIGGAAGAPGLLVRGRLKVAGDLLVAAPLPTLLRFPRTPDERR